MSRFQSRSCSSSFASPFGKHEFVVADRLDLEVVIELGQPLDLVPLRALGKARNTSPASHAEPKISPSR